mmetsp:Transcript_38353/g.114826  ORF Transcript_38353/g.114826 Transcript_38353/m.114826 type:complete len:292 (-) Transcript_38353:169-1044(-)
MRQAASASRLPYRSILPGSSPPLRLDAATAFAAAILDEYRSSHMSTLNRGPKCPYAPAANLDAKVRVRPLRSLSVPFLCSGSPTTALVAPSLSASRITSPTRAVSFMPDAMARGWGEYPMVTASPVRASPKSTPIDLIPRRDEDEATCDETASTTADDADADADIIGDAEEGKGIISDAEDEEGSEGEEEMLWSAAAAPSRSPSAASDDVTPESPNVGDDDDADGDAAARRRLLLRSRKTGIPPRGANADTAKVGAEQPPGEAIATAAATNAAERRRRRSSGTGGTDAAEE